MDVKKTLKQLKKEIDWRLAEFFEQRVNKAKKLSPVTGQIVKQIRDFTMADGKRIRPIFVYYGYLAGGGKNKKAILDAAIFIELIHSYLLIHDDIIDKDEKRRGELTIHCQYRERYKKLSKEAGHLGVCGGILAGDLVSAFGYEILAGSKFSPKLKDKAIARLNWVLEDVIAGQTLDIFSGVGRQLKKEDVLKILKYKTARYTIEGPMHIGAILAGADNKILQILSRYAVPLGVAFQIKDDILGMFGNQKITGKSAISDIKEGKQTFLILKARERANKKQKDIIAKVLGNSKATEKQIEEIKEIIRDTGALDYSVGEAGKLASQAKSVIEKSGFSKDVKQSLTEIADYILKREK